MFTKFKCLKILICSLLYLWGPIPSNAVASEKLDFWIIDNSENWQWSPTLGWCYVLADADGWIWNPELDWVHLIDLNDGNLVLFVPGLRTQFQRIPESWFTGSVGEKNWFYDISSEKWIDQRYTIINPLAYRQLLTEEVIRSYRALSSLDQVEGQLGELIPRFGLLFSEDGSYGLKMNEDVVVEGYWATTPTGLIFYTLFDDIFGPENAGTPARHNPNTKRIHFQGVKYQGYE